MHFSLAEERRRKVNLGGAAGPTHTGVLGDVKSQRLLRQRQKLEHDSAARIQAAWRALLARRQLRDSLRTLIDAKPLSLDTLRAVVSLGEEEALAAWSKAVRARGEDSVFVLAVEPNNSEFAVLACRAMSLALTGLARSGNADICSLVVSLSTPTETVPPLAAAIQRRLLRKNFLDVVARRILVTPKSHEAMPLLAKLATFPLNVLPVDSTEYQNAFYTFLQTVLAVPQLPNRLPPLSIGEFTRNIHFRHLRVSPEGLNKLTSLDATHKIDLLANLAMFAPTQYPTMTLPAFDAYLSMLAALLAELPSSRLDTEPKTAEWMESESESEASGSDDEEADVPLTLPAIPARTQKRVDILPSSDHIAKLLAELRRARDSAPSGSESSAFISFVAAIVGPSGWPSKKEAILGAVQLLPGASAGTYIAEMYHAYFAGKTLEAEAMASGPALLLLLDLFTQTLATMGDDEFFAFPGSEKSTSTQMRRVNTCNPLIKDELEEFTRQLMGLVLGLYFTDGGSPSDRSRKRLRNKIVTFLLAIHARDSRRSFLPDEHWHASTTKYINMKTIVEVVARQEFQHLNHSVPISARERAYLAPRLAVLRTIPFAVPFLTRAEIFQRWLVTVRNGYYHARRRGRNSWTPVTIRRDHVAEDGFAQLKDADFQGDISVTFVNKLGLREGNAGHHGLYKEFFTAICVEIFKPERGLWVSNEKHEIYPNPASSARTPESLRWFNFVGRVLGKALYEGILIDFVFAGFFLAKWLDRQVYLDDLASLDAQLYRGLLAVKHCASDEELEDLCLTFSTDIDDNGTIRTIDLIENGRTIPVTKSNRLQYIYRLSHLRLSWQIKPQSQAFFAGLSEMIEPRWLKMFNQQELQTLLGGSDAESGIDIEDLKAHTRYEGVFGDRGGQAIRDDAPEMGEEGAEQDGQPGTSEPKPLPLEAPREHPTITAFWAVVRTFTQPERRALLHFVTSCSRPPLLGFKDLNPHFTIQDMGDTDRHLPSSATCGNLLLLPRYTSEEVLREKLLSAIMSESGF
ncbi:HECT-domain-containing protein [Mycena kentingensis (nom. inval.)]|nr:HECT-domain-containing protein [Mycena kentingensis (nom. inval.)]